MKNQIAKTFLGILRERIGEEKFSEFSRERSIALSIEVACQHDQSEIYEALDSAAEACGVQVFVGDEHTVPASVAQLLKDAWREAIVLIRTA